MRQARKPLAAAGRALPGPTGGAYSAPPDLAEFKSGGMNKGRRKGETTGGDRQLREGDRNEGRAGGE